MTDRETARIYEEARLGGALARGERPAVVVVDLQRGFTEDRWPLGADMSAVVDATAGLLAAARDAGVPIVFTVIAYETPAEAGVWSQKMPGILSLQTGTAAVELDPRLKRRPDEPVLTKHGASAAHGTNLTAILTCGKVDCAVVVGATTSGCVRATVVDLMQAGLPVLVVRDCCGDRAAGPHEANLLDIQAKYADVIALDETIDYFHSRHPAAVGRPVRS